MKGFLYVQKGREYDLPPCFFCKHRRNLTIDVTCDNCIAIMDLATHKPNSETEFASFEPISEEHLEVLKKEQGGWK